MRRPSLSNFRWTLLLLPIFAGCETSQGQQQAAPPPPDVSVAEVISKKVLDYEDFPGRLEAINTIDVRARVTGFLEKFNFAEGTVVNKSDVLFEIDPRPYKAELDRTQGIVLQMEGRLKRLDAEFARNETLLPKNAISREDYDRTVGDRTEAMGNLKVALANQETAALRLGWTKVESPLTGIISQRYKDPGNLVKEDDTILTTIVDFDPIYAIFDVDERTALRLKKLARDKVIQWTLDSKLPVKLGLADEENVFPHEGTINFADNRIDPDTGTWRLRARFTNPDKALTPGMFVRVRMPIGVPVDTKLVSEVALATDQNQKYVLVVDEQNKVIYKPVQVGLLHQGLRAITKGLEVGDKVIVNGQQRARPGFPVHPIVVEMLPIHSKEPRTK